MKKIILPLIFVLLFSLNELKAQDNYLPLIDKMDWSEPIKCKTTAITFQKTNDSGEVVSLDESDYLFITKHLLSLEGIFRYNFENGIYNFISLDNERSLVLKDIKASLLEKNISIAKAKQEHRKYFTYKRIIE